MDEQMHWVGGKKGFFMIVSFGDDKMVYLVYFTLVTSLLIN